MKYEIEIKQACEGFWSCISPDAWIQTTSSILGALLAGVFAILVFYKQRKNDLENMKIKEKELFLKKYYELISILNLSETAINEIIFIVEHDFKIDKEEYLGDLEESKDSFNKMGDDFIPLIFIEEYNEVKIILNRAKALIKPNIDLSKYKTEEEKQASMKKRTSVLNEKLKKEHKKIKSFIVNLNEYAKSVKNELLKK